MATSTIVITYTAASGEVGNKVTSLTEGGTAYGSLTATQVKLARALMEDAAKLLRSPSQIGTVAAIGTLSATGGQGGTE